MNAKHVIVVSPEMRDQMAQWAEDMQPILAKAREVRR